MTQLPTLYTLATEYHAVVETLSNLDLPEEVIRDTLEGLAYPLEHKVNNVALFIRNLESTAEAIKKAIAEMDARYHAIENRANALRTYLKQQMEYVGIDNIESPYLRIAIRKNPGKVIIDCMSQIPSCFMHAYDPPPPPMPDKKAIATAIKNKINVPGAHLQNSTRLEIY